MHLLHLLLGLKDLKNRSFLRQLFYEIVLIMQNIIHCQLVLLKIQFLTFLTFQVIISTMTFLLIDTLRSYILVCFLIVLL